MNYMEMNQIYVVYDLTSMIIHDQPYTFKKNFSSILYEKQVNLTTPFVMFWTCWSLVFCQKNKIKIDKRTTDNVYTAHK